MPAPFFFSYAHNDALDNRLKEFFEQVNKRVRMITGVKEDGFLDVERLKAGNQWSEDVVDALRACPAMVCLYSPSYFRSPVCGQELQVFLERRLKYTKTNTGKRPANIIPVLWQPDDIPLALPDFEHERPRLPEMADEGVWFVGDAGDDRQFATIAHSVAKRVKEARDTPLPDLGYQPVLNGVQSAFEPLLPPAEFDAPGASTGPETATFMYVGGAEWRSLPFAPPDKQSLLYIAASVAKGRDLRLHALSFDPAAANLLDRVKAARDRKNLLMLLVDGGSLADAALAARLQEFDNARVEDCSTIVVWPGGRAAPALVPKVFRKLSERQPPFFHSTIDAPSRFAKAVGDSLDALQTNMLKRLGGASALQSSSDYASLPSISGSPPLKAV